MRLKHGRLDGDYRVKPILYILLLFSFVPGRLAHSEERKPLYPIRLEAALHAVLAAHAELAGATVELPVKVEARSEEPVLLAGPMEPVKVSARSGDLESSQGRVRIRCAEPGICMPLYVLVQVPPGAQATTTLLDTPATPAVLRNGAHAFLLIDSGQLHLRIPVTCLQGGTAGSMIHVAALAHGRIYQAAVVDGATVRGTL